MTNYIEQRLNMVESQVRPSDVTDRRIVRAMGAVAREHYVPVSRRSTAYLDEAIAFGPDAHAGGTRSLLPPRTFAKLAQLGEIGDNAAVLVIGSGMGYSLAVLARMARRVVGVEQDDGLASHARAALSHDGIGNAEIIVGPCERGHAAGGPYDAILVEGAIDGPPHALLDQLKDGGRLVAILASAHAGKAVVWLRSGKTFAMRDVFDAAAPPLPGFQRTAQFTL